MAHLSRSVTIYAIIHNWFFKKNHVFPVCIGVLKNKHREDIWCDVFGSYTISRKFVHKDQKNKIQRAALNSNEFILLNTRISACSFQLTQAIQRLILEGRMFQYYKAIQNITRMVKSLCAMVYVEEIRICETFKDLRSHTDFL